MLEFQISIRLSKEDYNTLKELTHELGESKSAVVKRAINFLKLRKEKEKSKWMHNSK